MFCMPSFNEQEPLKSDFLSVKVHMSPTVKFALKIAQVVGSSDLKHFGNQSCRRPRYSEFLKL